MQFFATQISPHIAKTAEGYLLLLGVPVARTAINEPQIYRGSELGLPTDDAVEVFRSKAVVFDKKFWASLESQPVTDQHPGQFVCSDNHQWYSKGHIRNVRDGGMQLDGESVIVADLLITDPTLAEKILSGQQREVSVGYSTEYFPNADGSFSQRKLRGNHLAIVHKSRCGQHCTIMDSIEGEEMPTKTQDDDEAMTPEERDALLGRILARLEQLAARLDEKGDYEEAEDEEVSPALQHLRAIKPAIQKSGDKKAIDSYNQAVRAIKAQRRTVLAADNARTPTQRIADAGWWKKLQADVNNDRSFGDQARCFHRRGIQEGQTAYEAAAADPAARTSPTFDGTGFLQPRKLFDPDPAATDDFVDSHRDAGRKMREKKS